jgi:hypothetical protein
MVNDLPRRAAAAQAAVKRFKGVPLAYGKNDCVRMAAFVLRRMGHRPQLGKAGSYRSAPGAVRALRRAGHETLAGALDGLGLVRIAPAAALPGDIVMLPAEGPFDGSLNIHVGNGRVLGYHEDAVGADILQPVRYLAAWRV